MHMSLISNLPYAYVIDFLVLLCRCHWFLTCCADVIDF